MPIIPPGYSYRTTDRPLHCPFCGMKTETGRHMMFFDNAYGLPEWGCVFPALVASPAKLCVINDLA